MSDEQRRNEINRQFIEENIYEIKNNRWLKKGLNYTSHQGNANRNHSGLLCFSFQLGEICMIDNSLREAVEELACSSMIFKNENCKFLLIEI